MDSINGNKVKVSFVSKKNAKTAKHLLDDRGFLRKDFRMVPAVAAVATCDNPQVYKSNNTIKHTVDSSWIAIPIVESEASLSYASTLPEIEATGYQWCPFSSKILGNGNTTLALTKQSICRDGDATIAGNLSLIQLVILHLEEYPSCENGIDPSLLKCVHRLGPTICPKRLERFGDDRTLVIPPLAFQGDEFDVLLQQVWNVQKRNESNYTIDSSLADVRRDFWRRLAHAHNQSPRVVRRGGIDPNSKVRQSGHRLLWPVEGIPEETGPCSSGWITVTEQGIRQSLDMMRVMFSRGNISEKIRFGKLVQEGEVIVDLYAGIGYYTLPAVVHGKASKVYACEWNEHAAAALKYNVSDNKISDRVEVLVGDSRKVAVDHNLVNIADRVSLGLLPSSEGGWSTAIRALKSDTGGWLHVHGNVPIKEKEAWALWVCDQLSHIVVKDRKGDFNWVVICTHVERVKSFAPTVDHYVADVFVGPRNLCKVGFALTGQAGLVSEGCDFIACPSDLVIPSCALSPNGVLCQEWMR